MMMGNNYELERWTYSDKGIIQYSRVGDTRTEYFRSGRKKKEITPTSIKKWRDMDGDVIIYHRQNGMLLVW
jgi:hypothetical protein